jgi:pimeloyl-ACP methyl ester carboxylesterase
MATFVLLHGAFLGGWCWDRVAARLRASGHVVHAPTLTGCGERFHLLTRDVGLATHVEDLVQHAEHQDLRDVILVGHSYGGTVMTAALGRMAPRVRALVFLDAQAPRDGETASGALADGTSERLTELSQGSGWLLDPIPLSAVGVTAPDDVRWVEPRRHAHPMRTLLEAVRVDLATFDALPKTYVVCTQHEGLQAVFGVDPLAPFAERARREGWRMASLDAPHDAMTTSPAAVADLLLSHA